MIPYAMIPYEPTYEPWQFLYLLIIAWTGILMPVGGLLMQSYRFQRFNMHFLGALIILLAILSAIFPHGWITLFMFNSLLIGTAPIGAFCITMTFTCFGVWSVINCMFPNLRTRSC